MKLLAILTLASAMLSFFANRQKTAQGFLKGAKMFLALLPDMLVVLLIASIVLAIVPEKTIANLLGSGTGATGYAIAATTGSIAMIPGFIAYPLAAILHKNGVALDVIAVFITTLIMVGVITLPMERKYFGLKVALIRNGLSLIGAIIVGLILGRIMI